MHRKNKRPINFMKLHIPERAVRGGRHNRYHPGVVLCFVLFLFYFIFKDRLVNGPVLGKMRSLPARALVGRVFPAASARSPTCILPGTAREAGSMPVACLFL